MKLYEASRNMQDIIYILPLNSWQISVRECDNFGFPSQAHAMSQICWIWITFPGWTNRAEVSQQPHRLWSVL